MDQELGQELERLIMACKKGAKQLEDEKKKPITYIGLKEKELREIKVPPTPVVKKRISKIAERSGLIDPNPKVYSDAEYEEACATFSDEKGIAPISAETLKRCFRMPKNGIKVELPGFIKILHMPSGNERILDERTKRRIGGYAENNGIVAFVARDGHTYIAKGCAIIDELLAAGFEEQDSMPVPLSKGEKILLPYLAERWNKLPTKKAASLAC